MICEHHPGQDNHGGGTADEEEPVEMEESCQADVQEKMLSKSTIVHVLPSVSLYVLVG